MDSMDLDSMDSMGSMADESDSPLLARRAFDELACAPFGVEKPRAPLDPRTSLTPDEERALRRRAHPAVEMAASFAIALIAIVIVLGVFGFFADLAPPGGCVSCCTHSHHD
jgi:hypothetical protein